MKIRSWRRSAGLVTVSASLVVAITLVGILAFTAYNTDGGRDWSAPVTEVSESLTKDGAGGYVFTGADLLEEDRWAMLIGENGQVVWSFRKPSEVPDAYTLTDVASFTRWYLRDYPVQCRVRDDGLLVVGAPKNSVWKHDMAMNMDAVYQLPFWFLGFFLAALGCVLALAYLVVRRWFRQAQQVRDTARSGWINGVSHDIRTPLSMVMGYAAQMEADPALPPERRRQASIIRAQSQAIRDLVNDLNLTMRLDSDMQALRREPLQPAPFLRQLTADFLNSGMAEGYPVEVDLPGEGLPSMEADAFLLRRAVNNLISNCVRHNSPGCPIALGARAEDGCVVFWVESGGAAEIPAAPQASRPLEADGGAAHGTGLKLVSQIAAAHGGEARFSGGSTFRCELWFPLSQQD